MAEKNGKSNVYWKATTIRKLSSKRMKTRCKATSAYSVLSSELRESTSKQRVDPKKPDLVTGTAKTLTREER